MAEDGWLQGMPTCVLSEIESYCSSTRVFWATSLHTSYSVSDGESSQTLPPCITVKINLVKDLWSNHDFWCFLLWALPTNAEPNSGSRKPDGNFNLAWKQVVLMVILLVPESGLSESMKNSCAYPLWFCLALTEILWKWVQVPNIVSKLFCRVV